MGREGFSGHAPASTKNKTIQFDIEGQANTSNVEIGRLIIAGWAGRDAASNQEHIDELKALGVTPPSATPMFYKLGAELITTANTIQVVGDSSSGEAEAVMICSGGELLIGVGSDHTDRKVETYGVTVSKQICPKPISSGLWRYEEVRPHWDELRLRSLAWDGSAYITYQEGSVSSLLPPDTLIELLEKRGDEFSEGHAMFCGTVPVQGDFRSADSFRAELIDPVLGRALSCEYRVLSFPIVD